MINLNSAFEDELYFSYLKDPDSVSPEWQQYFQKVHGKSVFVQDSKPVPTSDTKINGFVSDRKSAPNKVLNPLDKKINFYQEELRHIDLMNDSLDVPAASATRTIPIKVLDENRRIINRHFQQIHKPRVSFTQILAWAFVKALEKFPRLNDSYEDIDGKPYRIRKDNINVGLAIDIETSNGFRMMVVPSLKDAQTYTFDRFIAEFDRLIDKARNNQLEYSELLDTTITLTNPGMIGTTFSAPRLFKGQGLIVSTGSIDYPMELSAMRPDLLSEFAVSKVVNITSTYDHRIIQGAENAEFLSYVHDLFIGKHQFYEQIFYSLNIPFQPIKWAKDAVEVESYGNVRQLSDLEKSSHVMQMINAYRVRGHLLASINPLGFEVYNYPELDPAYYGFTMWDLDRYFHADSSWEKSYLPLRDIIEILRETYCGATGFEFMHIQDPEKKEWVKKKLETTRNNPVFSDEEKRKMLYKLIDAESFENYLHTKFVGSKRFSLEGGEATILILEKIFQEAADKHLDTIAIGMPHRGRLNVLVNSIGKSYLAIFNEFEGVYDEKSNQGSGDVKYHLGNKGIYTSPSGNNVKLLLAPNPSHLELVNPVVEGMARAIENQISDRSYTKVLPILLHGDSAFMGQGIVAETLNMSQLEGYKTGGTIHIIVNNQIGFTTTSDNSRSTIYATDIAKMLQTPILHVNGNDPEQVVAAANFAFEYRQQFQTDVIIDLICYRKYGHNEADEPTYTQPLLYKKIKSLQSVSHIYQEQLLHRGIISQELINNYTHHLKEKLDAAFDKRKEPTGHNNIILQDRKGKLFKNNNTQISKELLHKITDAITSYPSDFKIHPKIVPLLKRRREMVYAEHTAVDWAMAELLALGSLLAEGHEVRFTGQDSQRGTFSQRHAIFTDHEREYDYSPLNHIEKGQEKIRIFDSPLSEMAVLGYEYGYSVVSPNSLTLWEAQFGDFANNAQTIFDQYISCSEVKWGIYSNLVMLLPHGYDGQGPEHSSARIERYLQACAQDNIIVANLTDPAQHFHILRRQIYQPYSVPLVMPTPKGTLRHHLAVSPIEDFINGHFKHIIDDSTFVNNPEKARKVIICSGKIYFELMTEMHKHNVEDIAVIRVEQYYPFHSELFNDIISNYKVDTLYWMQEEPKNMGAWSFIKDYIDEVAHNQGKKLAYIGRPAAAATSTGLASIHIREQNQIIADALA
ncbi:MAG TPA: multifunctional oxoglutarate decarboxylase/oxoglutarate dehydrogenase thiamine pyrophosphate-binding subunit/dihydrolipoyllysine-residue succinyltransferase subunit [Candidatus Kapabacteria bacterium]|nr:multifunctional oxoglutarate decarboxylase/oxoglutarate dehydrogenase thiamine pyrophosphate-binding subunit/dihydrolipoyllysine-residue succinyltransferase subunit [Candidatus Kapabacteria bacterium]